MIPIVFENKLCLVVNKPSNMPVQKDFSRSPDMLSAVESYIGHQGFLIHRLDRHVAGPVLVAKTKEAAGQLNKQMTRQGFTKIYKAVVVHHLNKILAINDSITLEHYLKKEKSVAKVISKGEFEELKTSHKADYKVVKLKYKCLNTLTYDTMNISILEIELITGRFHQIRSQLNYVGLPIVGDPKYGETLVNGCKYTEIGLQSTTIKFKDPINNNAVTAFVEHFNGPFNLFQTK